MTPCAFEAVNRSEQQRPLYVRLAFLVRRWWLLLAASLAAALLNQATGIGLGLTAALLVAAVAQGTPSDALMPYFVVLAACTAGKAVFAWLEMWLVHDLAYGMLAGLRSTAYDRIEPLAPAYTVHRRTGDIVSVVMADIEQIEIFFAHTLIPMIVMVLVPSALLMALGTVALPLALVLMPFLLALVVLPAVGKRWGAPLGKATVQQQARVNAHFVDSLQGLREVIAFGGEARRAREVTAGSRALAQAQLRYHGFLGLSLGSTETLVALGALSVLLTGVVLVTSGALAPAVLPVALSLSFNALAPVVAASGVAQSLHQVGASARRYFELVDEPVRVLETAPAAPGPMAHSIEFDKVTFSYSPAGPAVLQGLSFRIAPGETVALVGPSGTGKSTCVSLLLRFWDPEDGAVRLGGVDLRDFPLEELRRQVAVVQQDNYLFNTSILENIRVGRANAADEDVMRAAQQANIHDFVLSLPDGYHTLVGERGAKLSGGQRQRLAIARAFLKNAPVLVLDEATSNLDSESEQIVRAAIKRLMAGRTTLVIAHRLSTIISADRVVMLEDGRVVAAGTHQELLAEAGRYAELLAVQSHLRDTYAPAAAG